MPNKPVELSLADGTKIALRPLTKHPDDKESTRAFYQVEQFANQVSTHLQDASKADEMPRVIKLTDLAAELRVVRDEKFAKFLTVYLQATMTDAEVLSKVVTQCGEDEMDFILAVVRSSPDYPSRELEALTYGSPVSTFETIAGLLKKNEAGRAYLRDWLQTLNAELTTTSPPSGT